ncbi:MAG: cell division protein FtsA [Syntrophobacter sp. DG_60]|nr:MAG: cell division protein FtsA [Syntrophobacter sp. DG_60]
MERKGELIVGLDIGTTKVCAVVGEVAEANIDVIGVGCHPAHGMERGVVINVEDIVSSIKRAVEEAELMAKCEIRSVHTGISGIHIQGFNSQGAIALKHREVRKKDVERVIEEAKKISIPSDKEIIRVLPQEFIVDDRGDIRDPIGIVGERLEVKGHVITACLNSIETVLKCIEKAGLDVVNVILQPMAASEAILTEDEKTLGVGLVDFGGGTTDLAIFFNNSIRHTAILGVGGVNITKDIALGLRTPISEAEKIKIHHGTVTIDLLEEDEQIKVPIIGNHKPQLVPKSVLTQIIQARVEQILVRLEQELRNAELKEVLVGGMVITGGSSILPGLLEEAEQIFGLPTRLGYPQGVGGLVDIIRNPIYATAVGLIKHSIKGQKKQQQGLFERKKGVWNRFITGFEDWFKKAF